MTPNERKALNFVRDYSAEHGYAPTLDETAKAVGYKNKSSAFELLANLVADGHLEHQSRRDRSYTIPETKERLADRIVDALDAEGDMTGEGRLEISLVLARRIILRELIG